MKKILFLFISLVFITGCEFDSNNKNTYKIELDDEPYLVCGKMVWFSNGSWDNELNIESMIETMQETCEVDKIEEVKEDIDILLNDDGLTKQDILWKLKQIQQYLNK